MSVRLGREISPSSPDNIFVNRVIASVEKRTGVPTRWNGRLPESHGCAYSDGSMTLDVKKVLEPARDAYRGKQLSPDKVAGVRNAVLTITHEAVHLSSVIEDPTAPGAATLSDMADRVLEEARAELWTHSSLDAVIDDIGMDQQVSGMVGQPSVKAYKAYTAATNIFAHGLAAVARVHPGEIYRILDTTDWTQRWNAVADLIIDQRLHDLMPPEHRDLYRQRLTNRMRSGFAELSAVQGDKTLSGDVKSGAGREAGTPTTSRTPPPTPSGDRLDPTSTRTPQWPAGSAPSLAASRRARVGGTEDASPGRLGRQHPVVHEGVEAGEE